MVEVIESPDRLESLLQTWADWMRRGGSVARGYPQKACGFAELGATSIQDVEDTSDDWWSSSIDAIIRGLPEPERSAINHQYLDSKYRFQIAFYAATLHSSKKLIQEGMSKKGIS